jgi:hypothetical protein
VPTRIEQRPSSRPSLDTYRHWIRSRLLIGLGLMLSGCGEPSQRELKNRGELEALLTAVSLKNSKELEKDAKRIDDRHHAGELSDSSFQSLNEIIGKARSGDWAEAEKKAYHFREQHPFFK